MWSNGNAHTLLERVEIGATTWENFWVISLKPAIPLLGINSNPSAGILLPKVALFIIVLN